MKQQQLRKPLKIHEHCHPLVRELFLEMNKQGIGLTAMSVRSGISVETTARWRDQCSPQLISIDACGRVVGMKLAWIKDDGR